MAYNLIECNREQMYLMPVSLRDWLPEGHLAWFVLDAVAADMCYTQPAEAIPQRGLEVRPD